MLESLIVYSITILLLLFILAIFSVLFQRWNIQTISNETATRMAQTYKLTDADNITGEISQTTIPNIKIYRYFFDGTDLKESAKKRITDYASSRLSKTTYTKNVRDPEFEVEVVEDSLSRRHIELKVSGEYSVPFGQVLSYFGFDSTTKYEVTSYADCVDLIDYIGTVDFVKQTSSLGFLNSGLVDAINSVLNLFDNIFGK